ncbi:MAG TPA: hypothetical protein VFV19_13060 [Candidatus Polarisedimenticolaceae bacterium]|nr:hypothetical protein [Candidatus Polarisedimenticolaceae bacterium]
MRNTKIAGLSVFALGLGLIGVTTIRADEIVQFTNGAEMPVQSHVVTKDMVKLDLGNNNTISFPLSMVNKIVSAGQDVFRNPTYYPANQAIAGGGSGAPSSSATQSPFASGRVQKQLAPGQAGMRLGEAADGYPTNDNYGTGISSVRSNPHDDMSIVARPHLDPMRPLPPGGVATIDPPSGHGPVGKNAPQMSPRTTPPPAQQNAPPPPTPPNAGEAGAPPEPPANDDGGNEPPPSQDPPNR